MTVDPVIAVGTAVAVGGFAYSLAEAYFRPWRERAQLGETTKLVIESLDGGEGSEEVEDEEPITYDNAKELLDAIRRVESFQKELLDAIHRVENAQDVRAEKATHAG